MHLPQRIKFLWIIYKIMNSILMNKLKLFLNIPELLLSIWSFWVFCSLPAIGWGVVGLSIGSVVSIDSWQQSVITFEISHRNRGEFEWSVDGTLTCIELSLSASLLFSSEPSEYPSAFIFTSNNSGEPCYLRGEINKY